MVVRGTKKAVTLRVDTVPFGPVSVGVRTFTRRGERRLVAVVKVTCELVDGASMRLLAPTPVTDRDLALRVPRAQLIVAGACHAPSGQRGVRIAIARGDRTLLDKQSDADPGAAVGLGPLPPESPVRRARLGRGVQEQVDRAFDVALPDDFDDGYFQAVPADQCASEPLAAGDQLLLVHLHPRLPAIRTWLPSGAAVALLQTDRGARRGIPLRLDTLTVLPEALRAELVWRGDIRVDDEALRGGRVGGAHGRGEGDFPDLASVPRARESTMLLDAPAADAPRARRANAGTMILESAPSAAPEAAGSDEEIAPPTVAMPVPGPAASLPKVDLSATVEELTSDAPRGASPPSMPFDRRSSERPEDPARRAPVPGAPWSPHQARRAPRARSDAASTMELESDPSRPPPAVASPPPSPAPAPTAPAPMGDPWRQDPPEQPRAAAPARAPRQRVSFRSDLYKKAKK